ncbi:hypothetical protein LBMAG42_07290 [Deltaproteobacteria bacterium]|nr:hypothetical protein LBMAG42_07290 [Deltaproteobacteria bacterium]
MLLLGALACALVTDADFAARFDLDGDGVPRPEDCDDDDAENVVPSWYPDADGDGWGTDTGVVTQCVQPAGYAALPGDCDDDEHDVNPGLAWYDDADGDEYGNAATEQHACVSPSNTVSNNADCDDTRADVSPASPELCDDANADEDCDGTADDDDASATRQLDWYADADSDGLGTVFDLLSRCDQPAGYTEDRRDCDDADPAITTECRWAQVSAGAYFSCALQQDGDAACWGVTNLGENEPPDAPMIAIAAGGSHACGILADGTLTCWGGADAWDDELPAGSFTALSIGTNAACALRDDGAIACWGSDPDGYLADAPTDAGFRSVSMTDSGGCALASDGAVVGWGQATGLAGPVELADMASVSCCGLTSEGQILGEQGADFCTDIVPAGTYTTFSTGPSHACGLRDDNTLACWGYDFYGQATAPDGTFTAVSAGNDHTCAIDTDGRLQCWGYDTTGAYAPPE